MSNRILLLRRAGYAAVALLATLIALVVPTTAHAGTGSTHCGFAVYGAIEDKYRDLGWEGSYLGCPTGTEADDTRGGRIQFFRWGIISSHPSFGTHSLWWLIANKWVETGREGNLGYPITDTTATPDGGDYNHFERSASIYWQRDAPTGPHAIYGAIRDKWAALGWEHSSLGYPISDEGPSLSFGSRSTSFEHGKIHWLNDNIISTIAVTRLGAKRFDINWTAKASWDYFNVRWGDPNAPSILRCGFYDPTGTGNGYPYCVSESLNGPDEHQTEVGEGVTAGTQVGADYLSQILFFKIQGCDNGGLFGSSTCTAWGSYQMPVTDPQA